MTSYLRYAALGDSSTVGVGDPVGSGWRGWARLLADALAVHHEVSLHNSAVSGATVRAVRAGQLAGALAHRPDVASLVVGVNDTLRPSWDRARFRADVLACAAALADTGALLLTCRFHDHGAVFGLPGVLRRVLAARLAGVNEVYDEVHATWGGVQVDLADRPDVLDRAFWSADRLHPSERGHRSLALAFAEGLRAAGVAVALPDVSCTDDAAVTWSSDTAWIVTEGVPWVGRRARDLGPWLAGRAWEGVRRPAPLPGLRPAPAASAPGGHDDRVAVGDGDGVLAVRTP